MSLSSGDRSTDFASSLRRLLEPGARRGGGTTTRLSSPTSADMATWEAMWGGAPVERRRWLVRELLSTAEADFEVDFRRLFLAALDDADPAVRATAVDGLWEAEDAAIMERFVRLLDVDDAPAVRARAAAALGPFVERGELGRLDPEAEARVLDVLVATASDPRQPLEVRRRAIESAGYAEDERVVHLIEAAHASSHGALRAGAIRAMGNSADERWAPQVLAALEADDAQIRFEAARAAGEVAIAAAVPRLIEIAHEADREIQIEAIWSLGEIGGERARLAAERMLASTDDPVLEEALEDAMATMSLSEGTMWWAADASDA